MSSTLPVGSRQFASSAKFRLSSWTAMPIAVFADASAFLGCFVGSNLLCSGNSSASLAEISASIMATAIFFLFGRASGLYRFQALFAPARVVTGVFVSAAVAATSVVVFLYLQEADGRYVPGAMIVFVILAPPAVLAVRLALGAVTRAAVTRGYIRGRRVILIGESGELERLSEADVLHFGIEEVARFALTCTDTTERLSSTDRIRMNDAIAAARMPGVTELSVIVQWNRKQILSELTALLRASRLPVRLYPDHSTRDILVRKNENHFDPYISIEVQREPLDKLERAAKRAFDIVFSTVALFLLSPLLLISAALVKIDSRGPVIFRQVRRGFDNREFAIWKFRTMTVLEDGNTVVQARRNDSRVTRIGRILRRTSIDELPQLVNVLKGEMSLVGPRPHAVAHDEEYGAQIAEYALRHHVKPGLTGAAQVEGLRGETRNLDQMQKRVERDIWYVNNWSVWLDLKIVLQTFVALI